MVPGNESNQYDIKGGMAELTEYKSQRTFANASMLNDDLRNRRQ